MNHLSTILMKIGGDLNTLIWHHPRIERIRNFFSLTPDNMTVAFLVHILKLLNIFKNLHKATKKILINSSYVPKPYKTEVQVKLKIHRKSK